MKCSDPDLQLGPMKDSDDYQATTRLLVNIRREQGRANTYIPKMQRTRRIPKCSARNNRIPMWALERHRDHHDHFQITGRLQVCEGLALRSSRVKHLEKCKLGRSIQYLMVRVQATTARRRRVHGAVVRWRPALVRKRFLVFLGLRVFGRAFQLRQPALAMFF